LSSIFFQPQEGNIRDRKKVVIVIGSRLCYRKGIDLGAEVLPRLCKMKFGANNDVTVDFLIGGDGPKRIVIEEIIEKHNLQSRVQMLGELVHSDVRDKLLIKGTYTEGDPVANSHPCFLH